MLFREGGTFQFQKLDKQTDSYFNTEFLQVQRFGIQGSRACTNI